MKKILTGMIVLLLLAVGVAAAEEMEEVEATLLGEPVMEPVLPAKQGPKTVPRTLRGTEEGVYDQTYAIGDLVNCFVDIFKFGVAYPLKYHGFYRQLTTPRTSIGFMTKEACREAGGDAFELVLAPVQEPYIAKVYGSYPRYVPVTVRDFYSERPRFPYYAPDTMYHKELLRSPHMIGRGRAYVDVGTPSLMYTSQYFKMMPPEMR